VHYTPYKLQGLHRLEIQEVSKTCTQEFKDDGRVSLMREVFEGSHDIRVHEVLFAEK
jgi:hypothetical protein